MLLLLHGAAGGWDELVIAAVGLGVLWAAVKLAGRKPATDEEDEAVQSTVEEHQDQAPPAAKVG